MSTTEDRKENEVYELGYLILPSVAEDSLSDVVNALKGIINKVGGVEIASEDPMKIDLAYAMSKTIGARKYVANDAYIGWAKFECEPSATLEISDAVKKLDEVLRFLLVKAPRETAFTFAEAQKKIDEAKAAKEAKPADTQTGDKPAEAASEPVVQ